MTEWLMWLEGFGALVLLILMFVFAIRGGTVQVPHLDARGWVAFGLWCLTVMILLMIREKPALTANQGFMFLAQSIIVSGLIGGVVAFLYTATKGDKPPAPPPGGTDVTFRSTPADKPDDPPPAGKS